MISVTVNDRGTANDLQQLGNTLNWRVPMTQSLALLQDDMAEYPAPPPGSTYRRTGTLGRLWTSAQYEISTGSGSVTGVIGNAACSPRGVAYGPFVQSADDQAWMHVGRWQTDEQVALRNTPAIQRLWADWMDDQI